MGDSPRAQMNSGLDGVNFDDPYLKGIAKGAQERRDLPGFEAQRRAQEEELRRRQQEAYARPTFTGNYQSADEARRAALAAGGQMNEATTMAQTAAMGDPNSQGQQALRAGLQRTQGDTLSAAGATRGGALAQASANRAALDANANTTAGGVSQSAELRAREMAQGREAYLGASNAQRDFGQELQGYDAQRAIKDRDLQAQQEEQRRQYGRGLGGAETEQFQGNINYQQGLSEVQYEKNRQAQERREAKQKQEREGIAAVATAGGGLISHGISGGDEGPKKSPPSDERGKRPVTFAEASARRRY